MDLGEIDVECAHITILSYAKHFQLQWRKERNINRADISTQAEIKHQIIIVIFVKCLESNIFRVSLS